jgi:hypothetical protein
MLGRWGRCRASDIGPHIERAESLVDYGSAEKARLGRLAARTSRISTLDGKTPSNLPRRAIQRIDLIPAEIENAIRIKRR